MQGKLLLENIRQLVTLCSPKGGPRRGADLAQLSIVEDGAVLAGEGTILSAGKRPDVVKTCPPEVERIDCGGAVVIPGFVDSHTHPAFVGPRLTDFEKRSPGATYEEIAAAGGGIAQSLHAVRQANPATLAAKIEAGLGRMLMHGTTTVEAKSGYGLTLESELVSLRAIAAAATLWPGTLSATLLGAHIVPPEYFQRPDDYVRVVCEEMIPAVARERLANWVDVFCDRGAFTAEQTEKIFAAAETSGLGVRAHLSQFARTEVKRFARFAPASLDHLDKVTEDDIKILAQQDIVATLLPAASYFLGEAHYPPARALIDAGAAVALATDYNPGSAPTPSMQFVLSAACTHMKMTPAEAIGAATINGAWALRLSDRKGTIEAGKDADLAFFDVEDWREIAYWFGDNHCRTVMAGGEIHHRGEVAPVPA